jgi:hypothetical protein
MNTVQSLVLGVWRFKPEFKNSNPLPQNRFPKIRVLDITPLILETLVRTQKRVFSVSRSSCRAMTNLMIWAVPS